MCLGGREGVPVFVRVKGGSLCVCVSPSVNVRVCVYVGVVCVGGGSLYECV